MKHLKYLEESIIYNERSLKRLMRSVTISQGQFSLILACCNYQCFQQIMMMQVRKLLSVELQEIVLSKTVNTLYTTIDQQLEKCPEAGAVMIFDLDQVEHHHGFSSYCLQVARRIYRTSSIFVVFRSFLLFHSS